MSSPAPGAEPLSQLGLARTPAYSESQWIALSYFNVYRLIIAVLFASLSLIRRLPPHVPSFDAHLSAATAAGYLLFAVIMAVLIQQRRGGFALLRNLQVPVDVLALTGSGSTLLRLGLVFAIGGIVVAVTAASAGRRR